MAMVEWTGVRGLGSYSRLMQRSMENSSETVLFKKGCTVSSPSSALTGDWIHQLIIKPQITHIF